MHNSALKTSLVPGRMSVAARSVPEISHAQFQNYAERAARDHGGVAAMHFRALVQQAERAEFERRYGVSIRDQREGSRAGVHVARPVYLPVLYRAAWEAPAVIGDDILGGEADTIAEKAEATGAAVAYVTRANRAGESRVVCLAQPVNVGAAPADSAFGLTRGMVEVCLTLAPLVHEALRGIDTAGMDIAVYDLSAAAGSHLVYNYPSGDAAPRPRADQRWLNAPGGGRARDLKVADRWWRVVVFRSAGAAAYARPWSVLVFGVCGALIFALLSAGAHTIWRLRSRLDSVKMLGQYVLEEELGSGSMGTVYRAHHSLLRRPTAVKLMPVLERTAAALQRFEREVLITASLSHPNTIAVYDFGHTSDGGFYYAMEYLEGVDLQRLVELHGPQPEERVVHFLIQVCGALAEAHAHGVIHRDIKPANLMLCMRGGIADFIKVLDFGLVKDLSSPAELVRRDFVGTPLYAAPEAVSAPDSQDARADLYALGAVAFFLLSGREVFRGLRVIDVLEQHATRKPPTLSQVGANDVSYELEAIVQACLEKRPEDRPASAEAVRQSLRALALGRAWSEDDAHSWWRANPVAHHRPDRPRSVGHSDAGEFALGATLRRSD